MTQQNNKSQFEELLDKKAKEEQIIKINKTWKVDWDIKLISFFKKLFGLGG